MSDRLRNRRKKRAGVKRVPLAHRSIGFLPLGPVDPTPASRLDDHHYDRRRRSLRDADDRPYRN